MAKDSLEDRVVAFAEQVGWIVGASQAKAEGWLDRAHLTEQLTRIRDSASQLLNQLQPKSEKKTKPTAPPPSIAADLAHAPGKRHRKPTASRRGVKHSDQTIAKTKIATTMRSRGRSR